jgi:ankyrin repeat protein
MITRNKLHTFKLVTLFAAFAQLGAAEVPQQTDYKKLSAGEKESCLINAVKEQKLDAVNALLDAGANPNAISKQESDLVPPGTMDAWGSEIVTVPVLAIAIEGRSLDIVQTLIKHGADVNATTTTEKNSSYFCFGCGGCRIVTIKSLIALAIQTKNIPMVKKLIESDAQLDANVVESSKSYSSNFTEGSSTTIVTTKPLFIAAIESECPEIVQLFIDKKYAGRHLCTLQCCTIETEHENWREELLDPAKRVIKNSKDPKKIVTPLARAIELGNQKIINTFITTLSQYEKDTLLIQAVGNNELDIVTLLLDAGANANAIKVNPNDDHHYPLIQSGIRCPFSPAGKTKIPVLGTAILLKNIDMARKLIAHVANVNAATVDMAEEIGCHTTWHTSKPLLILAIESDDEAFVQLLLDHHVDLTQNCELMNLSILAHDEHEFRQPRIQTPFEAAEYQGNQKIIDILTTTGVKPSKLQ